MDESRLLMLTNIQRVYEDKKLFRHLSESFSTEFMPDDVKTLKKIFKERKFILSIINGDRQFDTSFMDAFVKLINSTNFPVLILAGKQNIRNCFDMFTVSADYIIKPVRSFEFHLRINRLIEMYKIISKFELLKGYESEIDMRGNILELSRQELISGSETIKALDTALELSRMEMMNQKEEIMALEQILEYSRKDKMDLLSQIKAMEEIINYSSGEKKDYEKEVNALENLLVHVIEKKKNFILKNS